VEGRGGTYERGGGSGLVGLNPLQRMLRRAGSRRDTPVMVEDYNLAAGGRREMTQSRIYKGSWTQKGKEILKVVNEIGAQHIVHIVTDNGSNYKKACKAIGREFEHITWTPCLAHTVSLMLKDIGERPEHAGTISTCKPMPCPTSSTTPHPKWGSFLSTIELLLCCMTCIELFVC
jgi:hypothetical protein